METREFLHELTTPLSQRAIGTTALLAAIAGGIFVLIAPEASRVPQKPNIIIPIALAYTMAGIVVPMVA